MTPEQQLDYGFRLYKIPRPDGRRHSSKLPDFVGLGDERTKKGNPSSVTVMRKRLGLCLRSSTPPA